jgi:hypothetical protein
LRAITQRKVTVVTDLSDQPYETIAASRRYVLGEISEGDWEGYGIWDRLAGNRLVERFPPTEEGIDLALERFDELKWKDRRERWNLARVARITTVAGALLWLVAGTLATVFFTFGFGPGSLVYVLDAFGYRLAVGSLIVLGVLVLLQRMHAGETAATSLAGLLQTKGPGRGFDLVLWFGVVAGVVVWTLSSIATEGLFRLEFDPLGQPPRASAVAAGLVSTLSFRTWVASFVLLILRRVHLRGAQSTSSPENER